jgi:hypothetical protein
MNRLIGVGIELNAIRAFLEAVVSAANAEYSRIQAMSRSGEFEHYEDEANAYFTPMMWEEIAFRATLGELNALVEWELRGLAAGQLHGEHRTSRSKSPKMVLDLKMGEVIQFVEEHYRVRLNDIDSYNAVRAIRNKVNSFKHRKSFKVPPRDVCTVIGERYDASREEAYESIRHVEDFLKDLLSRIREK